MKMGDKRGPEGYYNHVIYSCMYGYKWQAKIWTFHERMSYTLHSETDQFGQTVQNRCFLFNETYKNERNDRNFYKVFPFF